MLRICDGWKIILKFYRVSIAWYIGIYCFRYCYDLYLQQLDEPGIFAYTNIAMGRSQKGLFQMFVWRKNIIDRLCEQRESHQNWLYTDSVGNSALIGCSDVITRFLLGSVSSCNWGIWRLWSWQWRMDVTEACPPVNRLRISYVCAWRQDRPKWQIPPMFIFC